jgi:hypothetical protein
MKRIFDISPSKDLHYPELILDSALDDIVHSIGPLPEGSVLLGIGYDGLPVLINLNQPRTGAILIVGEADSGKTTLLHSILSSAGLLNPDQISITIVTNAHYPCSQFRVSSMHLELSRPFTLEMSQNVEALFLLAKKRIQKEKKLPFIFFAIEDLANVYRQFNAREQVEFLWLLKHGPSAGIWPICTLTAVLSGDTQIPPDVIESFETCLWGHIRTPGMAFGLEAVEAAPLTHLIKHREFCLRLDSGWLRFRIIDSSYPAGDGIPPSYHIPDSILNATQGGHLEYWHAMV